MIKIGEKKTNIQYKKRAGVYVIIEREEDNKVAIVTDAKDVYFFLGGGIEKGESVVNALTREIIEETGYSLKNVQLFDQISSWCYSDKYGYIDVEATIYIANFNKKITEPIEKNHKILWVSPKEYKDKLYHEYQRYILNKYILSNKEKKQ